MFDLIAGKSVHVPSTPAVPIIISTAVQASVLAVIAVSSLLFATSRMPVVPDVLAFVAEMPPAAPPPPPAAPPPPTAAVASRSTPTSSIATAAPVEAPRTIEPEPAVLNEGDDEEGVPGGVEGGIPSGVIGGVPGLVEGPPPPPPPRPPAPRQIARIGGQIKAPALVRRVEPIYPAIAQSSDIEGIVILDAIVDREGHVQAVSMLRGHPLLSKAAIDAVKQWQYEPLLLNGVATPFELTVSLWFHFTSDKRR